jgi:hypothetical protein
LLSTSHQIIVDSASSYLEHLNLIDQVKHSGLLFLLCWELLTHLVALISVEWLIVWSILFRYSKDLVVRCFCQDGFTLRIGLIRFVLAEESSNTAFAWVRNEIFHKGGSSEELFLFVLRCVCLCFLINFFL